MAYTTTNRDRSSNVNRYTRDSWNSGTATLVDQKNTTVYWQGQNKKATTQEWVQGTTEPTNP